MGKILETMNGAEGVGTPKVLGQFKTEWGTEIRAVRCRFGEVKLEISINNSLGDKAWVLVDRVDMWLLKPVILQLLDRVVG